MPELRVEAPSALSPPASEWSEALRRRGARTDTAGARDFGDPAGELDAAAGAVASPPRGSVLCDLSTLASLCVTGADAEAFLHGQLTSDVKALGDGAVQRSAYCSPKGRMLATMIVRRDGEGIYTLIVPRAMADPLARRLSMFVLRAKVRITAGSACIFGLAGVLPSREAGLAGALATREVGTAIGTMSAPVRIVALADGRALILVDPSAAPGTWDRLATAARSAGYPVWQWLDIRAGIGSVAPQTSEAFVPQAANWDLIGGVSFGKGCYPGQEIVARTRYLGRLKERMFRFALDSGQPPAPGTRLSSPEFGTQAAGTVVEAAPAPGGGCELLAVVQLAAVGAAGLRLGGPDGPELARLPLPYRIPEQD